MASLRNISLAVFAFTFFHTSWSFAEWGTPYEQTTYTLWDKPFGKSECAKGSPGEKERITGESKEPFTFVGIRNAEAVATQLKDLQTEYMIISDVNHQKENVEHSEGVDLYQGDTFPFGRRACELLGNESECIRFIKYLTGDPWNMDPAPSPRELAEADWNNKYEDFFKNCRSKHPNVSRHESGGEKYSGYVQKYTLEYQGKIITAIPYKKKENPINGDVVNKQVSIDFEGSGDVITVTVRGMRVQNAYCCVLAKKLPGVKN